MAKLIFNRTKERAELTNLTKPSTLNHGTREVLANFGYYFAPVLLSVYICKNKTFKSWDEFINDKKRIIPELAKNGVQVTLANQEYTSINNRTNQQIPNTKINYKTMENQNSNGNGFQNGCPHQQPVYPPNPIPYPNGGYANPIPPINTIPESKTKNDIAIGMREYSDLVSDRSHLDTQCKSFSKQVEKLEAENDKIVKENSELKEQLSSELELNKELLNQRNLLQEDNTQMEADVSEIEQLTDQFSELIEELCGQLEPENDDEKEEDTALDYHDHNGKVLNLIEGGEVPTGEKVLGSGTRYKLENLIQVFHHCIRTDRLDSASICCRHAKTIDEGEGAKLEQVLEDEKAKRSEPAYNNSKIVESILEEGQDVVKRTDLIEKGWEGSSHRRELQCGKYLLRRPSLSSLTFKIYIPEEINEAIVQKRVDNNESKIFKPDMRKEGFLGSTHDKAHICGSYTLTQISLFGSYYLIENNQTPQDHE